MEGELHQDKILIPLLSMTTSRVLQSCKEYQTTLDDSLPTLFIASYPKSGTTWMQWIIYVLSQVHQKKEIKISHISHFTPFFEIEKTWDFSDSNPTGRINSTILENQRKELQYHVFNTHLPFEWLPQDPESNRLKYLYLTRNGKDAIVSFFHHLINQVDDDQYKADSFDLFLDDCLQGKIVYGKWIEHVARWLKAFHRLEHESTTHSNPILLLQYERLISDPFTQVQSIVQFLNLNISTEEINEIILPVISFQYMKEHLQQFAPISVPWKEGFQFIRKGIVGDSKNYFQEEENQKFHAAIEQFFANDLAVKALFQSFENIF